MVLIDRIHLTGPILYLKTDYQFNENKRYFPDEVVTK